MNTNGIRTAIYLRVSRDDQTTENQRLVLERVAAHRAWMIVQTYEDAGISGAKGRDQRPAFDQMLKDATRRRFDILMVWSIDRLGRSVLHVANALAELDAAGVRLYCDQQDIAMHSARRTQPPWSLWTEDGRTGHLLGDLEASEFLVASAPRLPLDPTTQRSRRRVQPSSEPNSRHWLKPK
jgi:hypothetical protein